MRLVLALSVALSSTGCADIRKTAAHITLERVNFISLTKELFMNQKSWNHYDPGLFPLPAMEKTVMKYRSIGAACLAVALASASPALADGGHGGRGVHRGGHSHGVHAAGFHGRGAHFAGRGYRRGYGGGYQRAYGGYGGYDNGPGIVGGLIAGSMIGAGAGYGYGDYGGYGGYGGEDD